MAVSLKFLKMKLEVFFYLDVANQKHTYQTVHKDRMICTFVVGLGLKQAFPYQDSLRFLPNEPRCEKTGLRGFRPGLTQTGLYSHRRWLET